MVVAWTTTSESADAERLARGAVEQKLAACAQVDAPMVSYFHWQGKVDQTREYRIWFKCLPSNASALGVWVQNHHPYDVPQWIVVDADTVGEKYLSWSIANSTSAPFHNPKQP
jgi:periplasmic divalent cation tolerance protein